MKTYYMHLGIIIFTQMQYCSLDEFVQYICSSCFIFNEMLWITVYW